MDALASDHILNEALLSDIGEGLDSIADRLAGLHARLSTGPDVSMAASIGTILEELGWWRGRIDAAVAIPSGTF